MVSSWHQTCTYMLELSQNVFSNAIFVKFGLNGGNNIVYDSSVDGRLKVTKIFGLSPGELLRTGNR
jgi:hypothetical protein